MAGLDYMRKPTTSGTRKMSAPSISAFAALDQAVRAAGITPSLPDGIGITTQQFAARYHLTPQMANTQILKLLATGKLKKIGRRGRKYVYDLC